MATITSVGSGLWSAAGTWDAGVPADGDDVVIASGHVVTFDVNQSAFITGVKVTITGTLTHTTVAGTYCLYIKTGNSLLGTGTWNIGTSGTPIPFAAKHTITGAAGWSCLASGPLTVTVYGIEPTYKYVRLSGDEAAGQTELSVDTDVTGDLWNDGDTVYICDINMAVEVEERIIAASGIAAGAITITSGLTAAKSTGAFIVLTNRNVRILSGSSNNELIKGCNKNNFFVGSGEFRGNANNDSARNFTGGVTVTGGCFHKCGYMFLLTQPSVPVAISDGVFVNTSNSVGGSSTITGGLFVGNFNAVIASPRVSGGIFAGNNNAFSNIYNGHITGGTYIGNTTVFYTMYDDTVVDGTNCTFSGNKYMFNRYSRGRAYNVKYNIVTSENYDFAYLQNSYLCSRKHDQVEGAFKSWTLGGITVTQTTIKPTGYDQAFLTALSQAEYAGFFKQEFAVLSGKSISIDIQLRKSASMTYLPRVYLMAYFGSPLAGATPIDSFIMTDSIDTWETDTFAINNATDYDQQYVLWFVGMNATGSMYSAYKITETGGGGGRNILMPVFLRRQH